MRKEGPQGSWLLVKKQKKEMGNIFLGATLFGEVSDSSNKEEHEEWLWDSGT